MLSTKPPPIAPEDTCIHTSLTSYRDRPKSEQRTHDADAAQQRPTPDHLHTDHLNGKCGWSVWQGGEISTFNITHEPSRVNRFPFCTNAVAWLSLKGALESVFVYVYEHTYLPQRHFSTCHICCIICASGWDTVRWCFFFHSISAGVLFASCSHINPIPVGARPSRRHVMFGRNRGERRVFLCHTGDNRPSSVPVEVG